MTVGTVVAPHGVSGEVRVLPATDFPERFRERRRLYLDGPAPRWERVEGARFHGKLVILKLAGCNDRDAAEALRGYRVQVAAGEIPPLPEGEYYHFQLLGLDVESADGTPLGRLEAVYATGANDVYAVRPPGGGKEILIPALRSVVVAVDLEAGRMVVALPPGLVEPEAGRGGDGGG